MRSIVIAALLATTAVSAAGQGIDSPYRFVDANQQVGVLGGYVFTDPGTVELGPTDAAVIGARYGIRISGPFGLEGTLLYMPTSRMVLDTVVTPTQADTLYQTVGEADLSLAIGHADLRFDLTGPRTWNGLMPYVLLGLGAAIRVSEDETVDEDLPSEDRYRFGTRLVGDLGAGVEWFPLERWTVRLDARDYLWKIQVPRGLRTTGTTPEEWVQNYLLSLGVSYRF